MKILTNQEVIKEAPAKYFASPMNFNATEHAVKYYTKNQKEFMEKYRLIINSNDIDIDQINVSLNYDSNKSISQYKLRVSLLTNTKINYLIQNKFETYRKIEEIINESSLDVSIVMSKNFTEEQVSESIKTIEQRSNITIKKENIKISKLLNNNYIINIRLQSDDEVYRFTKVVFPKRDPIGIMHFIQFVSTAEYLTKKYKVNKQPDSTSINNDSKLDRIMERLDLLEMNYTKLQEQFNEINVVVKNTEKEFKNLMDKIPIWLQNQPNNIIDNQELELIGNHIDNMLEKMVEDEEIRDVRMAPNPQVRRKHDDIDDEDEPQLKYHAND
ncbi:predicted protein [Naegleria gruberi]|uniref:Predicted protein n=1 Tax=Naegleria gruberi TaxID=5762 RepID=D2VCQ8_NAEGR|nr:uncharacterized protein NAEGRDRAFT_66659 [Naegleria gruberi]EFC45461.1 predicted protein [Naegleria gruberi]|eukprot:XP_002678205.1 predicted protein [Naegleria gruberi strain NEG-M]